MTQNIDSYFENGNGFHSNPFRNGYLTDEERKEPFRWYGENFIFFAKCADLSKGVEIYRDVNISYPDYRAKTFECALIRDCMMFGIWWRDNVHRYLNGFSGFDTVRVEIDPSLNMKIDVSL